VRGSSVSRAEYKTGSRNQGPLDQYVLIRLSPTSKSDEAQISPQATANDNRKVATYLWRIAQSKLNAVNVLLNTFTSGLSRSMGGLVIYAQRSRRTSLREPVNRDPSQDLIVSPWITIGPVVKFFIDPGEQGYRAVGKRISNSLWLST
jgi:hypothetical protein